jgi:hypothetical protein
MGRVLALAALAASLALAAATAATAYPWPVRPFTVQHPIRAVFGDPRTVFTDSLFSGGIDGPGSFSFHNGVDIAVPDGTPVYPVASGIVHILDAEAVAVTTFDGRTFQYFHIVPRVFEGQDALARITVLGRVQAPYGHVHLSEIDGTRITNPLLKGHLTPYGDHTRPTVESIQLRPVSGGGVTEDVGACGKVAVVAQAYDRPVLPIPGAFAGLPFAPELVRWRLDRTNGQSVVPWSDAVDFRTTLPPPSTFWDVYARGTYQNAPRFGRQQFSSLPGRYLFLLDRSLDTKTLPNGLYRVTVTAKDERANAGSLSLRFWVFNERTPTGCPLPPPPPPGTSSGTTTGTAETATTATGDTTTTTPVTDPNEPPH